jgi:hypothetical protein
MKAVLVSAILLLGLAAHADTCKKGDLKDCGKVLKAKEGADDFNSTYDAVCNENKTFKCLKRTVRGDIKEELKYMKEEFPKAQLFPTKESGEDKVFVLDKK